MRSRQHFFDHWSVSPIGQCQWILELGRARGGLGDAINRTPAKMKIEFNRTTLANVINKIQRLVVARLGSAEIEIRRLSPASTSDRVVQELFTSDQQIQHRSAAITFTECLMRVISVFSYLRFVWNWGEWNKNRFMTARVRSERKQKAEKCFPSLAGAARR